MSLILLLEQVLNGLQFGVMLFLMAAGLTLVFGVMGLIKWEPLPPPSSPQKPDLFCWL